MTILFIMPFLLLDTSHSLAKEEKNYNPIEFWDRLLTSFFQILVMVYHFLVYPLILPSPVYQTQTYSATCRPTTWIYATLFLPPWMFQTVNPDTSDKKDSFFNTCICFHLVCPVQLFRRSINDNRSSQ